MGTSIPETHYRTNRVIDGSARQEILNGHNNLWYDTRPLGLEEGDFNQATTEQDSLTHETSTQATFLNAGTALDDDEIKGRVGASDTSRNPDDS